MLCQFTFSNYRSYRDEATLDMQASKMREFSYSLLSNDGDKQSFLPVAAIYGPNAGGKSNIVEALHYACVVVARPIMILTRGAEDGEVVRIPRCDPFAFDDVMRDEDSSFEIYFRTEGYEYRFELGVSGAAIRHEALFRRKVGGSRAAKLYVRDGDDIALGSSLSRAGVSKNFNQSIPYLSFLYMNYELEAIAAAGDWFLDVMFINFDSCYTEMMLESMMKEEGSEDAARLLRAAGINIQGYRVEKADSDNGHQKVFVRHEVDGTTYELRIGQESAGTKKLLRLASFLLQTLAGGGVLVVDELDAKLHPKLLRFVVLLFKDPDINKGKAQLIFTSQDVSIMRNDVFRRDELWFAAKDEKGCESSQLWSLADIHEENGNLVSKNAAFDKQYLSGRYGADPVITQLEAWA